MPFRRSPSVREVCKGSSWVVVDAATGREITLSPGMRRVWRLLEVPHDVPWLVRRVAEDGLSVDEAEELVDHALIDLGNLGLLDVWAVGASPVPHLHGGIEASG